MINRRLFLLGLSALLTALPAHAADPSLAVSGAWIRLLPGTLPAGGYFTVKNSTGRARELTGASSPAYGHVMLHHSTQSGGQSHMVMVDSVTVPAHGTLSFAPGGYHLMLMQPKGGLKVGGSVTIMLHFKNGTTLTVPFKLQAAGASGP